MEVLKPIASETFASRYEMEKKSQFEDRRTKEL
jgi:hypothetical protein